MRDDGDERLEALCRGCGLCCDGSLFGRVDLDPGERDDARRNRLRVVGRGDRFEQPCSALSTAGGGCTIYAVRPRACRAFSCKLRERHRREGGPLDARLEAARRVRALLHALDTSTDDARRKLMIAEVRGRVEADFARA